MTTLQTEEKVRRITKLILSTEDISYDKLLQDKMLFLESNNQGSWVVLTLHNDMCNNLDKGIELQNKIAHQIGINFKKVDYKEMGDWFQILVRVNN